MLDDAVREPEIRSREPYPTPQAADLPTLKQGQDSLFKISLKIPPAQMAPPCQTWGESEMGREEKFYDKSQQLWDSNLPRSGYKALLSAFVCFPTSHCLPQNDEEEMSPTQNGGDTILPGE